MFAWIKDLIITRRSEKHLAALLKQLTEMGVAVNAKITESLREALTEAYYIDFLGTVVDDIFKIEEPSFYETRIKYTIFSYSTIKARQRHIVIVRKDGSCHYYVASPTLLDIQDDNDSVIIHISNLK